MRYRFVNPKNKIEVKGGGEYPDFTMTIQRLESGRWKNIGYFNAHLHHVKVDETDAEDVSVGFTARINTKRG